MRLLINAGVSIDDTVVLNIIGSVEVRLVFLIDMIDTALVQSVVRPDALAEAEAVEVYTSCTHSFIRPTMDNIQKSAIKVGGIGYDFIYRKIA